MMNRIILLTMLCVASASCVELENICCLDHFNCFKYKGVLVNAFHRVQQNATFGALNDYLIDDTVKCYYSQFENKANYWEILKFKSEYNRKFAELYTEDLKNNKDEEIKRKLSLLARIGAQEDKADCIKVFQKTVQSGLDVFKTLSVMKNRDFQPAGYDAHLRPTVEEATEMLEKLMNKLKSFSAGQRFAFEAHSAREIYNRKAVALLKEFKFLRDASNRVGPDSKGMATYELFFPFHNQNHDNNRCVRTKELPWFYVDRE